MFYFTPYGTRLCVLRNLWLGWVRLNGQSLCLPFGSETNSEGQRLFQSRIVCVPRPWLTQSRCADVLRLSKHISIRLVAALDFTNSVGQYLLSFPLSI